MRTECRKRLKDLAEAEGKPVAASPHPHDTGAVVPLQCLLPGERLREESGSGQLRPGRSTTSETHCCDSVK